MKGYKTVIFNVIMSVLMIMSLWNPDEASNLPGPADVQGLMDQAEVWISTVWGMGNVILRAVTTTAIFKKE